MQLEHAFVVGFVAYEQVQAEHEGVCVVWGAPQEIWSSYCASGQIQREEMGFSGW